MLNEREPVRRPAHVIGQVLACITSYEAPEMRQERNRASPSNIALSSATHPCQEGNQCTSLAALHESVRGTLSPSPAGRQVRPIPKADIPTRALRPRRTRAAHSRAAPESVTPLLEAEASEARPRSIAPGTC